MIIMTDMAMTQHNYALLEVKISSQFSTLLSPRLLQVLTLSEGRGEILKYLLPG